MRYRINIKILIIGLVCVYAISCNRRNPTGPSSPYDIRHPEHQTSLTISGKVTDALTELPISEAYIEVQVWGGYSWYESKPLEFREVYTNKKGKYSFNTILLDTHCYGIVLNASKQNYKGGYYRLPEQIDSCAKFIKDVNYIVDFKFEPVSGGLR